MPFPTTNNHYQRSNWFQREGQRVEFVEMQLLGKIGRSKGDKIEILNGHNWTALFNNTKWGKTYEIS